MYALTQKLTEVKGQAGAPLLFQLGGTPARSGVGQVLNDCTAYKKYNGILTGSEIMKSLQQ